MKVFESPYDFYRLPVRDRKHMIDQWFIEKPLPVLAARKRNGATVPDPNLYFPIGLTLDGSYSNYNVRQGVIFVTPVLTFKDKTWLRVGAFSPDDLDMDLDWDNPRSGLRDEVIAFIKTMPKRDVTYESVLGMIQKQFGGERTS